MHKTNVTLVQERGGHALRNIVAFLLVAAAAIVAINFIAGRTIYQGLAEVFSYPDTWQLPYYAVRTLVRMTAAYLLVLVFGLAYGIIAGSHEKLSHVMVPVLDILQSIPVLGYLPGVLLFFIVTFQGSEIGVEMASILLIFTGMAWAVAFGVFGGVRAIPKETKEVADSFGLKGFKRLRHVTLPAIYPPLISGSMLAWGGGWYFLIACEYFSFGPGPKYQLPGLGYYLVKSVTLDGSLPRAIFGLIVLVAVIAAINRLVWHPLLERADKYKFETMGAPLGGSMYPHESKILERLKESFFHVYKPATSLAAREARYLRHLVGSVQIRSQTRRLTGYLHVPPLPHRARIAAFLVVLLLAFSLALISIQSPLPSPQQLANDFMVALNSHPEAYSLPYYAVRSLLRLGIAYLIALGWTIAAGIAIARSRTLSNIFLPLFDIGQSVPALALFPFFVMIIINFFGGGTLGVEIAAILLLLTGMQWYLLFNIISAIKTIPGDILEASYSFGLHGRKFVRHVLLPAIFPAIVVGSIQAWGGGWNASIVSEYFQFGPKVYGAPGLGYFLDKASWEWGSLTMIGLSIAIMTGIILIMNRTIWRSLFKRAERYKLEY